MNKFFNPKEQDLWLIRFALWCCTISQTFFVRDPVPSDCKTFQLGKLLTCGSLTLNPDTRIVKIRQEEIKLTKKEYELLYTFFLNQGMILSREQLLSSVWGMDYYGDERTLDTHIRRLRNKIGEKYITTHIGIGYMLENQNE
ncbi:winged helix-turn-helix domain-containing protein [Robinsoniella sp. KNHs210]|uniref:winged helix-turn-helix domain-containing protein n=1 Tax=Robinsoniella sp. KNHs210 TaxID=1469950 RepID=UPI0009DEF17E|nr:response regulator transcription factor [Robinsoniella sp. KNHs210]